MSKTAVMHKPAVHDWPSLARPQLLMRTNSSKPPSSAVSLDTRPMIGSAPWIVLATRFTLSRKLLRASRGGSIRDVHSLHEGQQYWARSPLSCPTACARALTRRPALLSSQLHAAVAVQSVPLAVLPLDERLFPWSWRRRAALVQLVASQWLQIQAA